MEVSRSMLMHIWSLEALHGLNMGHVITFMLAKGACLEMQED